MTIAKAWGIRGAAVSVSAAALIAFTTPQAGAVDTDVLNLTSSEACEQIGSKFDMTFYYNSGLKGSWRKVGYAVYDMNNLRLTSSQFAPLEYCPGFGAGSGQKVKNNSASGWNDHDRCDAAVYYNSGFKGKRDVVPSNDAVSRWKNVYNENASFQWVNC